jgi:hypothetical protein
MQFLVILKVKPDAPREKIGTLQKAEATKAWEMMASGVLRTAYYIKGPVGAVLMLEASDEHEAGEHVSQLPLVEAGLLTCEILALTPFTGFASLFQSSAN